jgi:putative transposase
MSRKGDCYDHAPADSFRGTLKTELVHHRCYQTRAEAEGEIAAYIDPTSMPSRAAQSRRR